MERNGRRTSPGRSSIMARIMCSCRASGVSSSSADAAAAADRGGDSSRAPGGSAGASWLLPRGGDRAGTGGEALCSAALLLP